MQSLMPPATAFGKNALPFLEVESFVLCLSCCLAPRVLIGLPLCEAFLSPFHLCILQAWLLNSHVTDISIFEMKKKKN